MVPQFVYGSVEWTLLVVLFVSPNLDIVFSLKIVINLLILTCHYESGRGSDACLAPQTPHRAHWRGGQKITSAN